MELFINIKYLCEKNLKKRLNHKHFHTVETFETESDYCVIFKCDLNHYFYKYVISKSLITKILDESCFRGSHFKSLENIQKELGFVSLFDDLGIEI